MTFWQSRLDSLPTIEDWANWEIFCRWEMLAMAWLEWILRLVVSIPGPRTVRWSRLGVHPLEERTVPAGAGVELPTADIVQAAAPRAPYPQIGDRVWLDRNSNGFQDSGESGIGNVTLQLFQGNVLVGSTLSNPLGRYAFNDWNVDNGTTSLSDDGLKADTSYQIRIANHQPALAGLRPTLANQGSGYYDELRDSDAVLGTSSVQFDLTTGQDENYRQFDVGYAPVWSIGNLVWHDANNNGTRDPKEAGLGNVVLRLLDQTGTQVIATTVSAADGRYAFTDVLAGTYIVEIAGTQFEASGTLVGFASSTGKTGPDGPGQFEGANVLDPDRSLVDGDDNGTWSNGTVRSMALTVGAQDSMESNVDFGLFRATQLTGRVFVDRNGNGTIDAEDTAGLAKVRIRAVGPAGVFTTTTNASGYYEFGSLPAGTYAVTQLNQPVGYRNTTANWFTQALVTGTTNTTNFGETPSVDLRLRQSANLSQVNVGGTIVLTYGVANVGMKDATNVVLALPLPEGYRYVRTDGPGVKWDETTKSMTLGTLAAGAEAIVRIRVRALRADAFVFRASVSGLEAEEVVRNNYSSMIIKTLPAGSPAPRGRSTAWLFSSSRS